MNMGNKSRRKLNILKDNIMAKKQINTLNNNIMANSNKRLFKRNIIMENKKLIFGVLLTFLVCLSSTILASYMTNPVDPSLKYPNPGHYPGEIGPGTFNDSNSANPYWKFPGDLNVTGNLTLHYGDLYLNNHDISYLRWWWNPDLLSGIMVGDHNKTYFHNNGHWIGFLGEFLNKYGFFPGTPGYNPDRYLGTDDQWWKGASIKEIHTITIDTFSNPPRITIKPDTTIEGDLNVTGNIYYDGSLVNYDLVFANNFTITEAEDENALYFLNQKGEKIAKLDENGNLFVKGKITENFDFGE